MHNGWSNQCHTALGVAEGLQTYSINRKAVFLLVIEHILAPKGSESRGRENIHFFIFFPNKNVQEIKFSPVEGSKLKAIKSLLLASYFLKSAAI